MIPFSKKYYNSSLGRKSKAKLSPDNHYERAQLTLQTVDALGAPGILGIELREPKEEAIALLLSLGYTSLVMLDGKLQVRNRRPLESNVCRNVIKSLLQLTAFAPHHNIARLLFGISSDQGQTVHQLSPLTN